MSDPSGSGPLPGIAASAPPAAGSKDHGRLEFLDAIRGLAAPLVVLQHVLESFPAIRPFLINYVNLGAMGVSAFFLVSGFIIPFSLERAGTLGRFWVGRAFRIWPLYLLTLIIVTAFCIVAPQIATPMRGFEEGLPKTALLNVTMLQHLLRQPSAIGAYWTLSYEMVFYIGCSILFALGLMKRADWAVGVCSFLLALNGAKAWRAGGDSPALGFALIFLTFAVGMLVYRTTFGHVPVKRARIAGACAGVVVLGLFVFMGPRMAQPGRDPQTELCTLISYGLGFALFFGLYAIRKREFPRWMTYLGEISFSVYLVHGMFFSLGLPGGPLVHGLVVIGLTAIVSPLTYRFIEKPAVALGRKINGPRTKTT